MIEDTNREPFLPPIPQFVDPIQLRKKEVYDKLLEDKNNQIGREEKEKLDYIRENRDKLEQEAISLLKEIEIFNPDDIWQYKKGLRLSYIGTILNNKDYKKKGLEFYRKEWNTGY